MTVSVEGRGTAFLDQPGRRIRMFERSPCWRQTGRSAGLWGRNRPRAGVMGGRFLTQKWPTCAVRCLSRKVLPGGPGSRGRGDLCVGWALDCSALSPSGSKCCNTRPLAQAAGGSGPPQEALGLQGAEPVQAGLQGESRQQPQEPRMSATRRGLRSTQPLKGGHCLSGSRGARPPGDPRPARHAGPQRQHRLPAGEA